MTKSRKKAAARAILVGAAPIEHRWLKRELKRLKLGATGYPGDVLIGIDGGVGACLRAGVLPDFAIGDWDSLKAQERELLFSLIPSVSLKQDKDRSDLHFALESLRGTRADEIICFGVSGGRLDHELAALMDLSRFAERARGIRAVRVLSPDVESRFILPGMGKVCPAPEAGFRKGAPVSIFAWGGAASGVTLQGFRYPMYAGRLVPSSHGLSNHFVSRGAWIRVTRGTLLVVIPKLP